MIFAILVGVLPAIFSIVIPGISPRDFLTMSYGTYTGFIPGFLLKFSQCFLGFSAGIYPRISSKGFHGIPPRIPRGITPGVPSAISSRNYRKL